jgi:hypothetical protein
MRRWTAVMLGVLVSSLAACNDFDAALDEYCRTSRQCTREGDRWCVLEGKKCQPGDCCSGLQCGPQYTCVRITSPQPLPHLEPGAEPQDPEVARAADGEAPESESVSIPLPSEGEPSLLP